MEVATISAPKTVTDVKIENDEAKKMVGITFIVDGKPIYIYLGYGALHQLCLVDARKNYNIESSH
jgi:hypothetical protein